MHQVYYSTIKLICVLPFETCLWLEINFILYFETLMWVDLFTWKNGVASYWLEVTYSLGASLSSSLKGVSNVSLTGLSQPSWCWLFLLFIFIAEFLIKTWKSPYLYLIPVFGILSVIVSFNLLDSFCFGGFVFAWSHVFGQRKQVVRIKCVFWERNYTMFEWEPERKRMIMWVLAFI